MFSDVKKKTKVHSSLAVSILFSFLFCFVLFSSFYYFLCFFFFPSSFSSFKLQYDFYQSVEWSAFFPFFSSCFSFHVSHFKTHSDCIQFDYEFDKCIQIEFTYSMNDMNWICFIFDDFSLRYFPLFGCCICTWTITKIDVWRNFTFNYTV